MSGINFSRVLIGGVVAGIIVFVAEGIAGAFYQDQMQAALDELGVSLQMSGLGLVKILLSCFLSGTAAVFLYACARPRFGPGPKTASIVTLAVFLGSYVPMLFGYSIMGLFPATLLYWWAIIGLLEMLIAVNVGAWIYREG